MLKKTEILALDLGTKLGYYVGGDKKAHTLKMKAPGRMGQFFDFLLKMEKENKTKHIVYEIAAFQQANAGVLFHGFVGVLKAFCDTGGMTYSGIHTGTMKKQFTGKGRWTKEESQAINDEEGLKLPKASINKAAIIRECRKHNIGYDDDNSADAYGVYHVFRNQEGLL